jgi:hypothetical protein
MHAPEVTRLAALLICMTSLLILGACAPVLIRAQSAPGAEDLGQPPQTIRTL